MKKNRNSVPKSLLIGSVASGLLAAGLAVGLKGNGDQHPTTKTLPSRTEHALGDVIDKTLQDVGKQVIKFAEDHPDVCTFAHPMAGKILEITCEGPSGSVVKVDMEANGRGTSVPGKTILVSSNYQNTTTHQSRGQGFTLASPAGTKDIFGQTATYSGNYVTGWQAQEFGTILGKGNDGSKSYTYDTTNPSAFVTDYYPGGDPVSTAQTIVSDVPGDLELVLADIAGKPTSVSLK